VLASVRRARTVLDAAVVAAVAVVLGCLPAVLVVDDDVVRRIGGHVLAACVALGLGLSSRTVRGLLARLALLTGAAGGLLVLATDLLAHRSSPGSDTAGATAGTGLSVLLLVVVLVAVVGVLVVVAAVALGRGWQSVYWGRLGDLLEALAVGLALPAGLVAAGAVEFVRQLVS
jgi:hypothetical protein